MSEPKCKVCGTPDREAPVRQAIARRDANGGSENPTRLWRVGRKCHDGKLYMHANTDGNGWYFYAHTTEACAEATCRKFNEKISANPPDQQYVPVEIPLLSQSIPIGAVCLFTDGDKWCAVHTDFINLQESPAGFGAKVSEAIVNLHAA